MKPILQVENLNYIYRIGTPFEHQALDNVNFSVERGEFIGIIGHTGSGKSTLMQQLNGLLKPTSGKILLDGEDIWANKKLTRQARFRVGLGIIIRTESIWKSTSIRAAIWSFAKRCAVRKRREPCSGSSIKRKRRQARDCSANLLTNP